MRMMICPKCKGAEEIRDPNPMHIKWIKCPTCKGTGKIDAPDEGRESEEA